MASSSEPRWDALGSGSGFRSTTTAWDLRWWIILAVCTSVAAHGILFLWLKRVRMPLNPAAASSVEQRTGVFRTEVERVSIPSDILRDLTPQPPDFTQKVERPAVTELPDPVDLAEALKDRDLIAGPQLESPVVNLQLSTPAAGTAGDLLETAGDLRAAPKMELENSLLAHTSAFTAAAHPPAGDQVLLQADDPSAGGAALESELLDSMKKGTGGNGGVDGFMSLDDLMNVNGPVTQDFKTMLRTDLLFDFASFELRGEARLSLMKLAAIIQNNPDALFRLIGHTDTIGDAVSNQRLSEQRAQAVKSWLVDTLRIDGSNISAEGLGESEPVPGVNPAGTPDEQAMNRRVEIHKSSKPAAKE